MLRLKSGSLIFGFDFLSPFDQTLCEEIEEGYSDNGADAHLDVFAVFHDLVVEHLLWNHCVEIPSECSKNAIPASGTQSCVEQKFPKRHFGESGRNGDEMADAGDEPACDGSRHAVVIEIVFTFLHLF